MSAYKVEKLQEVAEEIIPQLLKAVTHVNKVGIMHRDIKPDNILLGKADRKVILLDFGCATLRKTDAERMGTPDYTAPEILKARENDEIRPYDVRVDAWSTGIVLFQIITGTLAFQAKESTGFQAMLAVMRYIKSDKPENDVQYTSEHWKSPAGQNWIRTV